MMLAFLVLDDLAERRLVANSVACPEIVPEGSDAY